MTTERELDEILSKMGREHRAISAPDKLEFLLCAAAANKKHVHGTPTLRVRWVWAAVVVLVAAVGVIWQGRRNDQPRDQEVRSAPVPQVRSAPMLSPPRIAIREDVHSVPVPVRRIGREPAGPRVSRTKEANWNALDEFVLLPVSEGLPPAAELSVVRMKLRGSDLRQYGLEAPPDTVSRAMVAEFVVGEDGLPRAIRIVR